MKKLFLFLFFLSFSIQANAAIALVSGQKATTYTRAATQNLAFPGNVTAGDLLVVLFQDADNAGGPEGNPAVTDTLGNNFILATTISSYYGHYEAQWIYYAISYSGGADTVKVVAGSNSLPDAGFDIAEFSGFSFILNNTGTGVNTGTSYSTSNVTINGTSALLVAMGGTEDCTTLTLTVGTNYNTLETQSSHCAMSEYRIVTSSGSYNATMSANLSKEWIMVLGAFTNHGFTKFKE